MMQPVGFRFRRSQARILSAYVDRFESDGHHQHVSLFRNAADAAASGEPLIVHCESETEMQLIAAGFAQFPGVVAPSIEQVSGREQRGGG